MQGFNIVWTLRMGSPRSRIGAPTRRSAVLQQYVYHVSYDVKSKSAPRARLLLPHQYTNSNNFVDNTTRTAATAVFTRSTFILAHHV